MTASGKTTLLRALIELAVQAGDRIIIIEDTPELNVPGDAVLHWATTLEVDMAALLRQALRHRPDRVIVGEVRGPEALELVRACNTGHSGVLATLHSNGGTETLQRLHTLVAEGQPTFGLAGVCSAIDADVHLSGRGSQRKLEPIWRVPRPSATPHRLAGRCCSKHHRQGRRRHWHGWCPSRCRRCHPASAD